MHFCSKHFILDLLLLLSGGLRALAKREYLTILFLISHRNHML